MTIKPFLCVAIGVCFLSAALTRTAQAQKTPDNLLVVPGQHLGRVFLGDSKAAVHRRLGAPQRTFKLAGGLTSELWRSKKATGTGGKLHTLEVVYRRGIVMQIEATNPTFKTVRQLSTTSRLESWFAVYGETRHSLYTYPRKTPQLYYDWAGKGVALEVISAESKVEEAELSDSIQTVIVHRKGAKVVTDSGGRLVS